MNTATDSRVARCRPMLSRRSMEAMRLAFLGRNITYLSGSADVCACLEAPPLSDAECSRSDECRLQGLCHLEIVHAFVQHVRQQHAEMAAAGARTTCSPALQHDHDRDKGATTVQY